LRSFRFTPTPSRWRSTSAVAERAARAYAQTLKATTGIQVFGTPSNPVIEMLRRQAGSGVPLNVKPHHLGGFVR